MYTVADLGGGMGGCIPPHQPKRNESGRKIGLNFGEDLFFFVFFFGDHLILGEKIVWISDFGRKIALDFGEDLFFFGDHLILGKKIVWISDFGRKIALNFGEDIRIFEVLCLKSPPTKIFWIRHWMYSRLHKVIF